MGVSLWAVSYTHLDVYKRQTPEGLLLGIRVSILDRLDRGLDRGKKQKIRRADILGIGMAAPGAVTADGILHGAVNIGWGDVALAEEAERIIGISPVCVGNDARLAALGEAAYGAGVGARSMLMVTPVSYTHLDVYKRQDQR